VKSNATYGEMLHIAGAKTVFLHVRRIDAEGQAFEPATSAK
jgi:hypothetical protein